MPHADVAVVLKTGFGLEVNRSTICRALDRAARGGQVKIGTPFAKWP